MEAETAYGGFSLDGATFAAHLPGLTVVPAVRTTARKMYVDEAYQRYAAMKDELKLILMGLIQEGGGTMFPARTLLVVHLTIGKSAGGKGGGRFGVWNCDIDNLTKSVLDAMNGIVYADDRYIEELHVRKIPVAKDASEYAIIHVARTGVLP